MRYVMSFVLALVMIHVSVISAEGAVPAAKDVFSAVFRECDETVIAPEIRRYEGEETAASKYKVAYYTGELCHPPLLSDNVEEFMESRGTFFEKFSRHQLLGYAALGMAGLAAVTSSSKSIHYFSAYSAAGLGAATCVDGIVQYRDMLNLEGAGRLYKSHAALGMIGAAGCVAACVLADSDGGGSHASFGVAGGALMLLSYTLLVW